jgi:DUF2950 family protein
LSRAISCALVTVMTALSAAQAQHLTFAAPEDAVRALIDAAKRGNIDQLLAIFGPEGSELITSSDPATSRKNREVFTIATAEQWHVVDDGANRKTLIIGNEEWPFPVPLAKTADGWRFDTAAGKEEVIARRIGRNELGAIDTCRAYVTAQLRYAREGHDGQPPGSYAARFRSDPGKENGLYWPAGKGQKRSPLGELVAQAAEEGSPLGAGNVQPAPFHGYYFRILAAPGGFGLIAWPAQYDVTGVMTFVVNQDGIVHEKDLGPTTDAVARKVKTYKTDASWRPVVP